VGGWAWGFDKMQMPAGQQAVLALGSNPVARNCCAYISCILNPES